MTDHKDRAISQQKVYNTNHLVKQWKTDKQLCQYISETRENW